MAKVVRDEEAREPHAALEIAEQVEDRGLNRDVQGGHGLVRDEDARLEDERTGDRHPLTLAARELV